MPSYSTLFKGSGSGRKVHDMALPFYEPQKENACNDQMPESLSQGPVLTTGQSALSVEQTPVVHRKAVPPVLEKFEHYVPATPAPPRKRASVAHGKSTIKKTPVRYSHETTFGFETPNMVPDATSTSPSYPDQFYAETSFNVGTSVELPGPSASGLSTAHHHAAERKNANKICLKPMIGAYMSSNESLASVDVEAVAGMEFLHDRRARVTIKQRLSRCLSGIGNNLAKVYDLEFQFFKTGLLDHHHDDAEHLKAHHMA
ncbi:hypothetical protein EJ06DRAFT_123861 [Trichodelitschia bisporula]|uniref:Uncharacterized protein n=1 Tax=Trichodelitschia bisporula TaxID=703511 RepID=A0A6G1HPY3_9PEZI|nr:hypothetical protein EJ06DRAFT_123861 [Trichodelitschia bisporula]